MKSALIGAAMLIASNAALAQTTLYVPDDHPTIQAAINAAAAGDTVIVRPGTYVEHIYFLGKAITVKSEKGPEVTIVDGEDFGTVVSFMNGETEQAVLEGFTITNGDGRYGGGVHCAHSSPTIVGNVITENEGGGIGCYEASPVIRHNTITLNTNIYTSGGGIRCELSFPVIELNTIGGNSTVACGGGIHCHISAPVIGRNEINGNKSVWGGDGIYCYSSSPVIELNTISGHDCIYNGGGIFLAFGSGTLQGNLITGNTAKDGGGIFISHSTSMTMSNNIIYGNRADNHGGGICCFRSDLTAVNNTVAQNTALKHGGGIRTEGTTIEIANSIFWGNNAASGKEISAGRGYGAGSHLVLGFSDIDGWGASVHVGDGSTADFRPGNINADPLFVDAATGDFHIPFDSPCRNAGAIAVTGLPQEDFEGDPRIAGGIPDMGADEFSYHLYHIGTVTPGGTVDLSIVGAPGMTVRLAHSLNIQDPPLTTPYGDLYLTLPHTWRAFVGVIPTNGILADSLNVPGFWSPGDEKHFQALIGPLGGPLTRLSNLETLEVE